MKKVLIATVLAFGAVLSVAPAALAADYPAAAVPPTSGAPGAKLSFSIQTGFANTDGTVVVEGDEVDTDAITSATVSHPIKTAADGLAKFGVLLPATATPGSTYKITVAAGAFSNTTSIKVADAQLDTEALPSDDETSAPVAIASDGGNPGALWFGGGALALVAGLIAVLAVRRSRKTKEAAE